MAAATNDVDRMLARLGGGFPPQVAREANQLLRKLALKMKPGTLGKHEVCRTAVAVELACRACNHLDYPRNALVKQSTLKEATYKDVLRRAEQALELRQRFTPRQLAVVLGGEQAADLADRLLAQYEARYRDSLQGSQSQGGGGGGGGGGQGAASLSQLSSQPQPLQEQPAFVAAAFWLATKKLKMKIDRRRLQEVVGVQAGELNNVVHSMQGLCADLLGLQPGAGNRRLSSSTAATAAAAASRKRPLSLGGAAADGGGDPSSFFSVPSSQESSGDAGGGLGLGRQSGSRRSSLGSDVAAAAGEASASARKRARTTLAPTGPARTTATRGGLGQQHEDDDDEAETATRALLGAGGAGESRRPKPAAAAAAAAKEGERAEPRLLRFKTEEERALYEGWKRSVLQVDAARKQRRASKGQGAQQKQAAAASSSASG